VRVALLCCSISFVEYCLFDRALLQKRSMILISACYTCCDGVQFDQRLRACRHVLVTGHWSRSCPAAMHSKRCDEIDSCNLLLPFVGMGWLRLVGTLKLQVSSAEYSLFDRALL